MRDRPRHVREIERLLEKGVNEEKLMWAYIFSSTEYSNVSRCK